MQPFLLGTSTFTLACANYKPKIYMPPAAIFGVNSSFYSTLPNAGFGRKRQTALISARRRANNGCIHDCT
jgi:hypothetical protein